MWCMWVDSSIYLYGWAVSCHLRLGPTWELKLKCYSWTCGIDWGLVAWSGDGFRLLALADHAWRCHFDKKCLFATYATASLADLELTFLWSIWSEDFVQVLDWSIQNSWSTIGLDEQSLFEAHLPNHTVPFLGFRTQVWRSTACSDGLAKAGSFGRWAPISAPINLFPLRPSHAKSFWETMKILLCKIFELYIEAFPGPVAKLEFWKPWFIVHWCDFFWKHEPQKPRPYMIASMYLEFFFIGPTNKFCIPRCL